MYFLKIIPSAQKDLNAIHGKLFDNLQEKIKNLSQNPRPIGVIKLTGEEGYRLRVGTFRILYRIDDKQKEIIIYRVKHRKDAYR
jgi:mRNA interferase RelE/StbE